MKIVCEACAAKYSIADDKVRGKVFKIRCKKCSHIIVVRGGGGGEASRAEAGVATSPIPPEPAAAGAAVAQWYVVVDGEQVGPLGEADVASRLTRGEVSAETYAWREGMADWSQLGSISEFAHVASAARAPAPASAPAGNFDGEDNPFAPQPTAIMPAGQAENMFKQAGGNGAGGDDFFGGAAPTAISAPPAGASVSMGDLFASQPAKSGAGGGQDMFAAPTVAAAKGGHGARAASGGDSMFPSSGSDGFGTAAVPAAGGGNLMGQRSENSVLFSLSNLEALAAPPASRPVSSSSPSPGLGLTSGGGGAGPTEGSGLIDIRAMASMTLGPGQGREDGGGGGSAMGDFPSFSAVPFSPVAAPLLPMRAQSGMPKWVIPVIVVGVLAIGGMAFAIIKMMSRSSEVPTVAAGNDPFQNPPPVVPPSAPAAANPPVTPPPTTPPVAAANPVPAANPAAPGAGAEPAAPAGEAPAAVDKGKKHSSGSSHRSTPTTKPTPAGKPEARPEPVASAPVKPSEPEKPKKGPSNSLDDLLAGALSGKKPSGGDAPAPERPAAAETKKAAPLGKQDIVRVMSGVMPKISSCYQKYKVPGRANVNIKVDSGGSVSSATVSGMFAGTPSGDCVESIIKSARFPASDSGMSFPYPVTLR